MSKKKLKIVIEKRYKKGERSRGRVEYFRNHSAEIGKRISKELRDGTWEPKPYKEKSVYDELRGKWRSIRVPCLYDQAVHHAIMRVTAPELLKRAYYYSCGSVPGAGQSRAVNAVKSWLNKKKIPKYAGVYDVKKFYETCGHDVVMSKLRRLYKDKRFLSLHEQILNSMGPGIAIGFYPSPWYANLVLNDVDKTIKTVLPDCDYARYMDDMVVLHSNKRKMKKAKDAIVETLRKMGMRLKSNWQIFPTRKRGIPFLSYRFFPKYTLVRKGLMYRIARRARLAGKNLTPHAAMSMLSYMGILKQGNGRNFYLTKIKPYVSIKNCKGVVRYVSKISRNVEYAATVRSAKAA
jgi:retron-type reverse transcriptase